MGLDLVEIVMSVEEHFGISIPDSSAEELTTVGKLHDNVMKAVQRVYPEDACMTSSVFYRIRRALMKNAGVRRKDVIPDIRLDVLLPAHTRRKIWDQLKQSTGLHLPQLERPKWVKVTIAVSAGAVLMILGLAQHPLFAWPAALLAGAWAMALIAATIPFMVCLPADTSTVRQLVYKLVPKQSTISDRAHWKPEVVWADIKQIVSNQLGVKPELITPEATWKHLGRD